MARLLLHALSCAALTLAATGARAAPSFTTLYNFQGGTDGAMPASRLVADRHFNLYGTTNQTGGDTNFGTIYKLAPGGTESVLHLFSGGNDGAQPEEGLLLDKKGNLNGGTGGAGKTGLGTLYKLTRLDKLSVLYSFPRKVEVDAPNGDLIADGAGNLFGTAGGGGASVGVIFELTPSKILSVLHEFQGADGADPFSGLITDASGTMYGTTLQGGTSNIGVLYSLTPSGTYSVLHNFSGFPHDGANPADAPVLDAEGNFYGVTETGGKVGLGTVYKLAPGGTETILHNFKGMPDGNEPAGRLVMDASGNLYGVTSGGGSANHGMVFKVAPSGKLTVLHNFSGGADGLGPAAGLLADAHGNYYGTTLLGGANNLGTIFKIRP